MTTRKDQKFTCPCLYGGDDDGEGTFAVTFNTMLHEFQHTLMSKKKEGDAVAATEHVASVLLEFDIIKTIECPCDGDSPCGMCKRGEDGAIVDLTAALTKAAGK